MKNISLKFETSSKTNEFMRDKILAPSDEIINKINTTLCNCDERRKAYDIVLKLPDFSELEPSKIANLNIFPYNFPHLYLNKLKDYILKSELKTLDDLINIKESFQKEIEAIPSRQDITVKSKRYPGSFELGERQ